jgi:ribosomal protein S15P/S13E
MSVNVQEILDLQKKLKELIAQFQSFSVNDLVNEETKALIKSKIEAIRQALKIAQSDPNSQLSSQNIQSDIRDIKFKIISEEYKSTVIKYGLIVLIIIGGITYLSVKKKIKIVNE